MTVVGTFVRPGPLDVSMTITAGPDRIIAEASAHARSDVELARLGWCVLLPSDVYAGAAIELDQSDGPDLTMPFEIARQTFGSIYPKGLFEPASSLALHAGDVSVKLRMEGGRFDLEDQRNWSDPSFKAYPAPRGPWPMRMRAGERLDQRTVVTVAGVRESARLADRAERDGHDITATKPSRLPSITLDSRTLSGECRPCSFASLNTAIEASDPSVRSVIVPVNAAVHDAADRSILASTRTHGELVAATRRLLPSARILLGPIDFGDVPGEWRDHAGAVVSHPAVPSHDPRRSGGFGAAWMVASIAEILRANVAVSALAYFDRHLPEGPARRIAVELGALEGQSARALVGPAGIIGLTVGADGRAWFANRGTRPERVHWNGRDRTVPPTGLLSVE
jgi:hypothetical protein